MRAKKRIQQQCDTELEHYKILKSFIKNVISANKYIYNQTLKFNLKINGGKKVKKKRENQMRRVGRAAI